jgi:1-deoxy-D-xylulose-5-phosphate reductoisomerase
MHPSGTAKRVIVLGSTGSIGRQTIEVINDLNSRGDLHYEVVGLAAGRDGQALCAQAKSLGVWELALADEQADCALPARRGPHAAAALVREVRADLVVAAIVGVAGLEATLAAISMGTTVALANKETLVAAGSLVIPAAQRVGVAILPLDSEHSGVWQCLMALSSQPPPLAVSHSVSRVILTASGGPFRNATREQIEKATPEQALAHPRWSMGAKVTIDSASLMNKALELIEAHWLFGLAPDRLSAVVHPQSVVHAMIELADGSVLAQLGDPDMRTPIQVALTYPHRVAGPARRLSFAQACTLEFEPPDLERFPALLLADRVMHEEGTSGAVLNAANEQAVELFLQGSIRFGQIPQLVERALDAIPPLRVQCLEDVQHADERARHFVRTWTESH